MSVMTATPHVPATAAGSAPTALSRRLPSYAVVGSMCTVAYLVLFWALSAILPSMAANTVAMLTTAIANTAANRRFTFGVTGRAGAVRDHLGGLIAFLIGMGISTLSLAVIPSDSSAAVELAAVILANGLASAIRFVLLQGWVFNPRLRPAAPSAGPAAE
ncbi:GtrA family protein [Nonomuraea basaltis]|uniref:GtrA family protein n=1 Tax=Nonomuraea basaltis TaxID=2495887 RepID=UPI00110C6EE3|nr:GtrA family protein [Nonomuraea basaltis]TMR98317.1 GtrA family protein [Nonomuraea basaltis]